jgi:hypothetical protein
MTSTKAGPLSRTCLNCGKVHRFDHLMVDREPKLIQTLEDVRRFYFRVAENRAREMMALLAIKRREREKFLRSHRRR